MIFYCKATLNMENYDRDMELYHKEIDVYNAHVFKMQENDLYKIENADTPVDVPTKPEYETGYVKCNFKKDIIIGYEVSGSQILLMINFSMSGQGSYIIKYDDKIIEELDNLLD